MKTYNTTPSVLLTANHSTTESGNSAPVHNGITAWIEVSLKSNKFCMRRNKECNVHAVLLANHCIEQKRNVTTPDLFKNPQNNVPDGKNSLKRKLGKNLVITEAKYNYFFQNKYSFINNNFDDKAASVEAS